MRPAGVCTYRFGVSKEVVGLVMLENGIYLAALVVTRGLPLAVELGVAIDVLVGPIFTRRLVSRAPVTRKHANAVLDRLREGVLLMIGFLIKVPAVPFQDLSAAAEGTSSASMRLAKWLLNWLGSK